MIRPGAPARKTCGGPRADQGPGMSMNVVTAFLPADPVTSTVNSPSRSEPGKSRLIVKRTKPSRPVTGLTGAVRSNVPLDNCGGLFQISETVTGVRGAKPLPWTTQAVLTAP